MKLNLLGLKNGKVYRAFRNGVELSRKFFKLGDKLYNDAGSEEKGRYSGCAFIPAGRDYSFEETKEQPKNVTKDIKQSKNSVLTLVPQTTYYWTQQKRYVTTDHRGYIHFSDKKGLWTGSVHNTNIPLSDSFKKVVKKKKAKRSTRSL